MNERGALGVAMLLVLSGCSGDSMVPSPVELFAFGDSNCTIGTNGVLHCWGYNEHGLLGYGHTQNVGDDENPCSVGPVDVGFPVHTLGKMGRSVCAISALGHARCWGKGAFGEDFTSEDQPASEGATFMAERDIVQLVGGSGHSCALLIDGVLRCWGAGELLGYGDSVDRGEGQAPSGLLTTLPNVPLGGEAVSVVAGTTGAGGHTCALLRSGSVRCWGAGSMLGYGTNEAVGDDETPEQAGDVPLGGKAISLVASNDTICALLEDRTLRCWGWLPAFGMLGYGDIFSEQDQVGDDETPEDMGPVPVGEPVERVFVGGLRTCVLLEGGRIRCWGSGLPAVLGYGPSITRLYAPPQDDVEIGGPVRDLVLGREHGCALLDEGVRCWGLNNYGQLGLGTSGDMAGLDGFPIDVPLRSSCDV
jgi:alpha-tubulin suppressor-like RCC1 family protein